MNPSGDLDHQATDLLARAHAVRAIAHSLRAAAAPDWVSPAAAVYRHRLMDLTATVWRQAEELEEAARLARSIALGDRMSGGAW